MSAPDRRHVTIDLEAELHRSLCEAAEREGMDLPSYCRSIIKRDLGKATEAHVGSGRPFDIDDLLAFRDELLGDRVFPGNSVDLIREAREERTKQLDEWR